MKPLGAHRHARTAIGLISGPTLLLIVLLSGCSGGGRELALARAAEAWDAGEYERAAQQYETYLENDAESERALEARLKLANIYYLNLNRYEQARTHYKEFLRLAPSHPESYPARKRLAEVLAELGRWFEAIAEYENLDTADVIERRRVRLAIADLYFNQKNYSQALTEYARVTESAGYDELSEQAHMREASILHIVRDQYREAIPVYEAVVAATDDPEVMQRALFAIADCHANLYEFDRAIETLRRVDDPEERDYIARRIAEFEEQKREASHARTRLAPGGR